MRDVVAAADQIVDRSNISGTSLRANTSFDFEQQTSYPITVRVTDNGGLNFDKAFTINVTNVNDEPLPPNVTSVVINDGMAQRSSVKKIEVVFDSRVNTPASAFSLTNLGSLSSPTSTPVTGLSIVADHSGPVTIVTISLLSGQSLPDGNYRLDINGAQITPLTGGPAMTSNYVFGDDPLDKFFRNYGDADGDGFTDFDDFASGFLPNFGTSR